MGRATRYTLDIQSGRFCERTAGCTKNTNRRPPARLNATVDQIVAAPLGIDPTSLGAPCLCSWAIALPIERTEECRERRRCCGDLMRRRPPGAGQRTFDARHARFTFARGAPAATQPAGCTENWSGLTVA